MTHTSFFMAMVSCCDKINRPNFQKFGYLQTCSILAKTNNGPKFIFGHDFNAFKGSAELRKGWAKKSRRVR